MTVTEDLYGFVQELPRFDWECKKAALPANGIYLFFEKGECAAFEDGSVDRIVRVGTHTGDGNFPGRIRQHYGHMKSLGGNKNGSVFRTHVGGALLRRIDEEHPLLATWIPHGGASDQTVESQVSAWMREHLTFSCVSVSTKEARLSLERGLISLLAQQPLGAPSTGWLGRHAVAKTIQTTGLWNKLETGKTPLTEAELGQLMHYAVRA